MQLGRGLVGTGAKGELKRPEAGKGKSKAWPETEDLKWKTASNSLISRGRGEEPEANMAPGNSEHGTGGL